LAGEGVEVWVRCTRVVAVCNQHNYRFVLPDEVASKRAAGSSNLFGDKILFYLEDLSSLGLQWVHSCLETYPVYPFDIHMCWMLGEVVNRLSGNVFVYPCNEGLALG
jgi:hypothetical protein